MGWTVLYIAFGVVALWLLGEVLLQYKARLRWRLLAFAGFLGVVFGVLIPSVPVIAVGAIAFAVGQTYVTLSFRRGFEAGWAVSRPGEDDEPTGFAGKFTKRRGKGGDDAPEPGSAAAALGETAAFAAATPEGFPQHDGFAQEQPPGYAQEDPAYDAAATAAYQRATAAEYDDDHDDVFTPARPMASTDGAGTVYEPQPMPDETGTYGVYQDTAYATAAGQPQDQYAAQGTDGYGYDYASYGQQNYGYDATGEQQYAAYSDPYIGTQTYGGATYDPSYDQQYPQQGYPQDQYATGTGTYGETPPGGVWVPHQRNTDDPNDPSYYQGGQQQPPAGNGYDEQQYRF